MTVAKSPRKRSGSVGRKTPISPSAKKKASAKSPKARTCPPKSPGNRKKVPAKSPRGKSVPRGKSPARGKSPGRGKSPARGKKLDMDNVKRTPSKRKREDDKDGKGSAKKRKVEKEEGIDGCTGFSAKMWAHAEKNAEKKRLEIQALRDTTENKADMPKWPVKQLKFKAWHDEAFDYVRLTFKSRGWIDLGNICDLAEIEDSKKLLAMKSDESRITGLMQDVIAGKAKEKLPKYCLWWVHEDDARRLTTLPTGKFHVVSSFLGTNAAVTKVATTQQNDGEHFFPKAFILPKQAKDMAEHLKEHKNSYWIAKPRNDYAGRGVVVYNSESEEFKKVVNDEKRPEFVVQTYLHKPLLVGGYKFHFRMYTVLTGVLDNFEAYLYKDGHALFSTKKYTNDLDTLGDKFDEFVHLTNWSINYVKGNKHLKENKDVIGVGCEWSVNNTLKFIKKARPEFDVSKFWKDMTEVCAVTMFRLAQWRRVKHFKKENDAYNRFENFGLDIIMDENFKVWLMEANTEVGLNAIMEDFPDESCTAPSWKKREGNEIYCTKNGCVKCRGGKNLRFRQNNKVLSDVIHSSLDLLQLDVPAPRRVNKTLIPLHPVMNHQIMTAKKAAEDVANTARPKTPRSKNKPASSKKTRPDSAKKSRPSSAKKARPSSAKKKAPLPVAMDVDTPAVAES